MKTVIFKASSAQFNLNDGEVKRLLETAFFGSYKKTFSTEIQRQYHFTGIDTFDLIESVYDEVSIKDILKEIGR